MLSAFGIGGKSTITYQNRKDVETLLYTNRAR